MNEDGTGARGEAAPRENTGTEAEETGLVLDDELRSAASPFLYLLTALLIVLGGYFLYYLLHS